MIDQVLVAKGNADDALHHQGANLILDQLRPPTVAEARRKAFGQPDRPIGRTEQQRTSIRGDRPAVETGDHGAAHSLSKFKLLRATLCRHRGHSSASQNRFVTKELSQIRNPDAPTLARNAVLR